MNRMVEEIALVSETIQNQDDEEVSSKIKLHHKFNSKRQLFLWIVLFICLLIVAGPVTHYISYSVPAVKPRHIADDLFSEERVRDYLINLTDYGSRVSNTRGNFDARDYLLSQIERICSKSKRHLQFDIDFQNFDDSNQNQLQNIVVRVSNPVTKFENKSSLMLSAHYDSGKIYLLI
jgi:hypothetical protein